jgi:hypothetical protein
MVPEPKSGFPVSLWAALDRGSPHTPREYHREGIGARQRIFRVFGKNVIIFVFVFIFSGYLKITVCDKSKENLIDRQSHCFNLLLLAAQVSGC